MNDVIDVFVSHYGCPREMQKRYDGGTEDCIEHYAGRKLGYHHRFEDPREKLNIRDFYGYAFERFIIVLHETRFLRYAKALIAILLRIDATSILVKDEMSGKISGVWSTCDEMRYRIRIDELDIFGMEAGCVVVR